MRSLTTVTSLPSTARMTWFWKLLGLLSVGIGIVNLFLPLMPTTVFLLIGVWAWGKGAPEWQARLLAHPRLGPPLRDWQQGGQISRKGKWSASVGMALGWLLTFALVGPRWPVALVAAILLTVAAYLWSRPEPRA